MGARVTVPVASVIRLLYYTYRYAQYGLACAGGFSQRSTVTGVKGKIVALCSLCGHEYARLFDAAESAEHLAEAHGMYFDPRPLRHPA